MNGRLVISDTYLRCAHMQFQLDPNSAHNHYLKGRSNYILHLGMASIILWLLGCKSSNTVTSVGFYSTSKLLCCSTKKV